MREYLFRFLVVAEDGTSHEHHHRITGTETVDDLVRAAVGGWLEHIRVADPALALWCDEEGRPRGRTLNPVGSRLVRRLGGLPAAYVGPIVITGNHHHTAVSLTADQIDRLLVTLRRCHG